MQKCGEQELQAYFEKAKQTIITLTANLVKPTLMNHLFFEHYGLVNRENTIKLLMRASHIYHNREKAARILRLVSEINDAFSDRGTVVRLLHDNNPSTSLTELRRTVLMDFVHLLSKCLIELQIFCTDNQIFKSEFVFHKQPLRQTLLHYG